MRGIWKIGTIAALSLFLTTCASAPSPERCATLRAAVEAADDAGDPQLMTATRLAYSAAGCGTIPMPEPEPTCPPPPTGPPVCEPGYEPDDPSWACGVDTEWKWLGLCKILPPDNPPPPPPPPPPATCQDIEHRLVAAGDPPPQFRTRVKVATSSLGDLSGTGTQEEMHKLSSKNLKILAAKIMELNPELCAFGGVEALFIKRSDGLWGEYHAVYFGKGSWTDNGFGSYKGSHRDKGAPVPTEACGPPTPPPASELGVKRFGGRPGFPKFDARGLVKDYEYCKSVGFKRRGSCPVRLEPVPGGPWQDRVACEKLIFGTPVWKSDGEIHPVANGNPWMRHVTDGTWVQVCTGPEIVVQVCSAVLSY